jgi:hypothetical protein
MANSEYRDAPTCEIGFWEPLHSGCPVCGPNGPCRDPDYEALIQANLERKRFRRAMFKIVAILLLGIAFSYGLGQAREPQSQWLWGNVLGLL